MKIAFVSANRERLPDPVVPLGLLYVMAATPDHHDTELWDLCFAEDPKTTLIEGLKRFQPDLVAMGLRNIQNCDYTGISDNLRYYRSLVAAIREHSEAKVVLGGGGFSVMPEGLMRELRPDFGIRGEGERAFPALIDALAAPNGQEPNRQQGPTLGLVRHRPTLDRIGSLLYFDGERLRENPIDGDHLDLDALALPDRRRVDARYYANAGVESVQTKRGCPLKCDYCTYPIIEGRTVRQRDPIAVVDEMQALAEGNTDVSHFFVVDSVFNIPPKHAKAICREMIARDWQLPWTCYANPLGFDAELAELMREARCEGMEIGSDSGCDEILERLRKGFDTKKVRQISQLCRDHQLKDCHTFLLGTPGETMDHVQRTMDFIADMAPFAAVLMAYKDDEEALDPSYALERQKLRDQVIELLDKSRPEFPRWVIPALEVNFQQRLFDILRSRRLRGPLWQHLDLIRLAGGGRGPNADTATPSVAAS
jgi:radical SAM superfamily enzyme YgiQ (UPF0313 family)